jgi:hypothetical protein
MVQAAVDSVTAKQAAPKLGQLLIAASSHERKKGICLEPIGVGRTARRSGQAVR